MKSNTLNIKLFLKTDRQKRDGTATIFARVRFDRNNKIEITSNKSIEPKYWNDAKGIVVKHTDARTINTHLETFVSKINNAYSHLYIAQQEITLEALKAIVLEQPITPKHTLTTFTLKAFIGY